MERAAGVEPGDQAPGAPKILMTYAFDEREDGGTHFEVRFAKPKPKDLPFYEHIWPNVQSKFAGGIRDPPCIAGGAGEGSGGGRRAASARFARTVHDAADPRSLAQPRKATSRSGSI